MARVTVEDCVLQVPNRFELVLRAAQRARDVSAGAPLTIDRDNDKNPVIALREIAEKTVDHDLLNEELIVGLQKHHEQDEPEEDKPEFDALEGELAAEMGALAGQGAQTSSDEEESGDVSLEGMAEAEAEQETASEDEDES